MAINDKIAQTFSTDHYSRINSRRLEHLATLQLDLFNKTVLELGAGIGDLSGFFIDRECHVSSAEARMENLDVLQERWPQIETSQVDFDVDDFSERKLLNRKYDIVFSYGILYHLRDPARLIRLSARCCSGFLLLETCVDVGTDISINLCSENKSKPTQSFTGVGCRPTRQWIYKELKKHFTYVYTTRSQPAHTEFPLNWKQKSWGPRHKRAIFIASNTSINNPNLVEGLANNHRPA